MVRGELYIEFQEVEAIKYNFGDDKGEEITFITDTGDRIVLAFSGGSFEKIVEAIEKYEEWNGGFM